MKAVDAERAIRKNLADQKQARTAERHTASEKELIPWPSVF